MKHLDKIKLLKYTRDIVSVLKSKEDIRFEECCDELGINSQSTEAEILFDYIFNGIQNPTKILKRMKECNVATVEFDVT